MRAVREGIAPSNFARRVARYGSLDPARIDPALGLSVEWVIGDPSPFAGTRFDGRYVRSDHRVYYLGFRTLGDVTDGSVWYYYVPAGVYADTGVDMPVPVSNYGIAALHGQNVWVSTSLGGGTRRLGAQGSCRAEILRA